MCLGLSLGFTDNSNDRVEEGVLGLGFYLKKEPAQVEAGKNHNGYTVKRESFDWICKFTLPSVVCGHLIRILER